MKDTILQILGQLYEHKYNTDEYDDNTVTVYYTFLTGDLGLETELQNAGINSAKELQEQMLHREEKMEEVK